MRPAQRSDWRPHGHPKAGVERFTRRNRTERERRTSASPGAAAACRWPAVFFMADFCDTNVCSRLMLRCEPCIGLDGTPLPLGVVEERLSGRRDVKKKGGDGGRGGGRHHAPVRRLEAPQTAARQAPTAAVVHLLKVNAQRIFQLALPLLDFNELRRHLRLVRFWRRRAKVSGGEERAEGDEEQQGGAQGTSAAERASKPTTADVGAKTTAPHAGYLPTQQQRPTWSSSSSRSRMRSAIKRWGACFWQ